MNGAPAFGIPVSVVSLLGVLGSKNAFLFSIVPTFDMYIISTPDLTGPSETVGSSSSARKRQKLVVSTLKMGDHPWPPYSQLRRAVPFDPLETQREKEVSRALKGRLERGRFCAGPFYKMAGHRGGLAGRKGHRGSGGDGDRVRAGQQMAGGGKCPLSLLHPEYEGYSRPLYGDYERMFGTDYLGTSYVAEAPGYNDQSFNPFSFSLDYLQVDPQTAFSITLTFLGARCFFGSPLKRLFAWPKDGPSPRNKVLCNFLYPLRVLVPSQG
uniref:Uncharacterized protein n=1 Tax=Cannabis sativa TaxID=3483 RepID=A0A803QMB1_CANSA